MSCDTNTTLGLGSSERFEIHDGTVCFDSRNLGCHMVEGPESHGSMSTAKVPGSLPYRFDGTRCSVGEKVRRKVVSPFRCLILRDMTYHRRRGFSEEREVAVLPISAVDAVQQLKAIRMQNGRRSGQGSQTMMDWAFRFVCGQLRREGKKGRRTRNDRRRLIQ